MKFRILIYITFLILSSCGSDEWGFVKELPENAIVLNEYKWTDGFLPDYDYYLAAKMTESDFIEYAKKFELTEHYEGRDYGDQNWSIEFLMNTSEHDWWNPDFNNENFKHSVWQGGDEWVLATYQNGVMYLHGMNH